ncbi:ribose-phosphate pyrophosphokinase [Candidatus Woesearchaeota archaeon]|nr:ribose-phosphate pyrophosphokinase [Candidatus Woesearchaeota archaeon]
MGKAQGSSGSSPSSERHDVAALCADYLHQESPPFLFYNMPTAASFAGRLEQEYKELWKRELELGEMLSRHRDAIIAEDADKVRDKIRRLRQNLRYEQCDNSTRSYNNGEVQPSTKTNIRDRSIDVVCQFGNPSKDYDEVSCHGDIIELYFTLRMMMESSVGDVTVVAPWLPYMRGDKKLEGRVPIAARDVLDLIEHAALGHLKKIITFDLHAAQEQGFLRGKIEHLSAMPLFARYVLSERFTDRYHCTLDDLTVVAVDTGGVGRAHTYADLLGLPVVVYDKGRPEPGVAEVRGKVGQVETNVAVIIEDMIDTGGSVVKVGADLLANGVKHVVVLATHGLFSPTRDKKDPTVILNYAEDILEQSGVHVVVTDSIPRDPGFYRYQNKWLVDTISLSQTLADAILQKRLGYSLSQSIARQEALVREHARQRKPMEIEPYLLPVQG